ncbi:uncharacterized protein LOC135172840 [Diachasmimorpha longicaudata]|uniref:uncharacterized protein LOC135172840 n=1 Tax=Diachasmimorpha longicaudata TaxID=58733 RepID=UPI0030B8B60A
MLICDDDEPSPVSSDEVFFICEEQTNVKCDDRKIIKDSNDKMKIEFYPRMQSGISKKTNKPLKTDSIDEIKYNQKKIGNILSRKKNKKLFCDASSCTADDNNQIFEKIITTGDNDDGHETAHTILVKIQVENCSQCPDKSISVYSHDMNKKKINCIEQCKIKNSKTVAVQVNFNSIESAVDSQCVKISKIRRCSRASRFSQTSITSNKGKKTNDQDVEKSPVASASSQPENPTKIYLWRGKNFKSQSMTHKTNDKSCDGVVVCDNDDKTKKIQEKSFSVDRGSFKKKKSQAISPNKKTNRSSLTIGSDNITINLSKYSPCASRLAASSKILGNNVNSSSALSPESPLHAVRPRSPGRLPESGMEKTEAEKITLQASLSLNIDQFKKTHPTPRSRSVGDSCVTSPTSEATTTMSYSPTGTEILSLDDIGQHHSTSNDLSLSAPDLKILNGIAGLTTPSKVNLETKC